MKIQKLNPCRNGNLPGRPRIGMTFPELIVTMAILAIIVALLLPATRRAGSAARRTQCRNNLKRIGFALHNYHEVFGSFPPAYTVDASGKRLHSWRTLILPFVDQAPLYKTIDLSRPWDDPVNQHACKKFIDVYQCPSAGDMEAHHTTYLAVVSANALFRGQSATAISDFQSNSSNMVVFEVEQSKAVPWMSPYDISPSELDSFTADSETTHRGGTHALCVEGHVRFFTPDSEDRSEWLNYKPSKNPAENGTDQLPTTDG